LRTVSIFEEADWEELEAGVIGDGPGRAEANFIVTDVSAATHRRYRNRRNGEVIISRIF
jgi:hypothetical protein